MAVRVRKDIWDLGDETDPWRDPAILAYAKAIRAMQRVDQTDPTNGASWINQAAIHERRANPVAGRLEDQCQHASWFFLPWHRMYLFQFESIIRSHMSAADAATWALPYWNYTRSAARRALPPAFRRQQLPDGTPNPLFVTQRQRTPLNMNGGARLPVSAVRTQAALRPTVFTRPASSATQGFGGVQTGFHHNTDGFPGPLEFTPHGDVHVVVGGRDPATGERGFMGLFGTAALDPIFWLHHANLDRLWEVWLRRPGPDRPPGRNPTASAWRTMQFDVVRPNGQRVKMRVEKVLDSERDLEYTYSELPPRPRAQREAPERPSVTEEKPPEMVGATDEPVTLTGATHSTQLAVSPPKGPARRDVAGAPEPVNLYLNIEDIEGDVTPGLVYGVYVNLPEGEEPDEESPHLAGTVSFFGIENTRPDDDKEEAPHQLRYTFDITAIVDALKEQRDWDPEKLRVTFSPVEGSDEELAELDVPPVKVGRVSLFVE
ncbi:MAG: tyrosinase family protein [Solirubrobacteraceae bacterium]